LRPPQGHTWWSSSTSVTPNMLQAYVSSVSGVSYACCKCFMWILHMLQWLFTCVASVYSKCFICFFRHTLQMCLFGCCIYFTNILQMFYLNVEYALQRLFKCFMFFASV
jgi:hypothetical protein